MTDALDRLAEQNGILLEHWTMEGTLQRIPDIAKTKLLAALGVDPSEASPSNPEPEASSEPVKPEPCFLPPFLQTGRGWGVAVMLYELRSARDWGIGDFVDLASFAQTAAQAGADFVGVNPLHALFLAAPERASPFSPSSRLFLNPLYVAPDRLDGGAPNEGERAEIERLRASDLVNYAAVARLKLGALRRAFAVWTEKGEDDSFNRFRAAKGEALERHALFEALSAFQASRGLGAGWRDWPPAFQDHASPEVRRFAAQNEGEVRFHLWLQFVASAQLESAAETARNAGMRVGIYLDFAVGEAPDGSATWSKPDLMLPGMTIGAPPDMFTAEGQDWALSPPNPQAMAREGFATFKATMEALMGSAGALRIDHVMALQQLFLVPADGKPAQGAYLRYPINTLLNLLGDASQAHRVVVIGEDLGVVPPGFRDTMGSAGVLSYRILYFERGKDYFIAPHYYPPLALACLSTHDMPTWTGWWQGTDIGLRRDAGLIDEAAAQTQRNDRARERALLVKAMRDASLLPKLAEAETALRDPDGGMPLSLLLAAHAMIAATPSVLACARLADMVGERTQTNLPGTDDTHPNWRPRLATPIEAVAASPTFQAVARVMAAERPASR